MADATKNKQQKIIETEEEQKKVESNDDDQIQNNMLKGDVSSSFDEASAREEEITEPSKVAPEKKLDKAIINSLLFAQEKVIKRLFQTDSFS